MSKIKQIWLRHHFVISVSSIVFAIGIGGQSASQTLQFYRSGIHQGEWWRLITGHLVHLGWGHLVLNVAGLLLVWAFYVNIIRVGYWYGILLFCLLLNGLLLYALDANLTAYVGLSGVLHGLFICGGVSELRLKLWRNGLLLLLVVTAKLTWEQLVGSLPGTSDMAGGTVYVNAHLYGAYAGVIAGLLLPRRAYMS